MKLPIGANMEDFKRCKEVIKDIKKEDSNLDEITLKIMNISYSKGGDYSEKTILEYAKAYLMLID